LGRQLLLFELSCKRIKCTTLEINAITVIVVPADIERERSGEAKNHMKNSLVSKKEGKRRKKRKFFKIIFALGI
jgi:hypothetical protein